jgi:hypothetical protein
MAVSGCGLEVIDPVCPEGVPHLPIKAHRGPAKCLDACFSSGLITVEIESKFINVKRLGKALNLDIQNRVTPN